jgi:alkanesulfonate monooxygenase SsuD/methylene tetrahydromethanopterin reductase-like flavin-dependent oxidoreductase (luciferase family)
MKAQIGLMVEGQMGLDWPRWQRVLEMAERVGYQCVFRSDHFTNPAPPDLHSLELFTSLTYAATATRRIEFGSLVAPVTFRHPMMTVRQAAAIDDLSGGRLVLGLGAGWQRREHENYGIPFGTFTSRFAAFTDALEVTSRLLRQNEPVTVEGPSLSVKDAVLLPRPRRATPILIGGNGEKRSLPLAARFADEWNGVYLDVAGYRARNRRLDELLDAAGRDPRSVKRSLMGPFSWALGNEGIERLEAYVEAGVQRFMLQYVDYDNLAPVEEWAARNLSRFHG